MNRPSLFVLLFCLLAFAEPRGNLRTESDQLPARASGGVITGHITDESGQPVVGARVQAVGRLKKWMGPYYEIPTGRPDESDDRGHFRLHSLPPGPYVVAVSIDRRQPASERAATADYLRTYNPGTTSLVEAQPIAVQDGKEQTVSIRVAPVRWMSVTGVATTSDGLPAANFAVSLRGGPAAGDYNGVYLGYSTPAAGTQVAQDGSFLLERILPGAYVLTISNGHTRQWRPFEIAEATLNLTDTPITGLSVVTAPGASVSGRLEWAGTGPAPWPWKTGPLGRIRATPVDREPDFSSLDSDVQADGTFQFPNLYGMRRIESMGLPFNWAVKAVEAPNNVFAGPNIVVTPGRSIADLKVIVTNRTGSLRATVVDEDGRQFPAGRVLLLPLKATDLDALGWGLRVTQMNRGSNDVLYAVMDTVLPGAYLAVAIDVEPYRLIQDTDLMERARAAAVRVEIGEGETTIALRVVRLRSFVRSAQD